jgi:hypothetical protein
MMTKPAVRNLPVARNEAATMLMTNPKNVNTFGFIFESASPLTISLMMRFAPKPIARV